MWHPPHSLGPPNPLQEGPKDQGWLSSLSPHLRACLTKYSYGAKGSTERAGAYPTYWITYTQREISGVLWCYNLGFESWNRDIWVKVAGVWKTKSQPRRDSNPQSSDPKSDALSIRPRGPPFLQWRKILQVLRIWAILVTVNSYEKIPFPSILL